MERRGYEPFTSAEGLTVVPYRLVNEYPAEEYVDWN
jgi:hypothetical protein